MGAFIILFLFLRKRRNRLTNHSPDFNEDTSDSSGTNNEKSPFRKIFGAKVRHSTGAVAGMNDMEQQINNKASGVKDSDFSDDDFAYRGVSNNNNLESVFRSSGSNTSGPNTGQNSNRHSRMNSYGNMLGPSYYTLNESAEGNEFSDGRNVSGRSEKYYPAEESLSDESVLLPANRTQLFGDESASNNSRSRFQEEF